MANSSLLKGLEPKEGTAPRKGGPKGNEAGKMVFAVALLVIAAGVIAWSQGWLPFGHAEALPENTAEQKQEYQKQQQRNEVIIKSGKAVQQGSS